MKTISTRLAVALLFVFLLAIQAVFAAKSPVVKLEWSASSSDQQKELVSSKEIIFSVTVLERHDTICKKGLGTHANSEITYNLGGKYARFEAEVGVTGKDNADAGAGTIIFEVYQDEKQAYHSALKRGEDCFSSVSLDVRGTTELRLVATDGGDDVSFDHAGWGNARLIDSSGKRVYLSDLDFKRAEQDWGVLHFDKDVVGRPLLFGWRPYKPSCRINATLEGRELMLSPTKSPGQYACRLSDIKAGTHQIDLEVRPKGQKQVFRESIRLEVK